MCFNDGQTAYDTQPYKPVPYPTQQYYPTQQSQGYAPRPYGRGYRSRLYYRDLQLYGPEVAERKRKGRIIAGV